MHIRINIPSWGSKEIARGAVAIASGGRSHHFRRRLRLELQTEAPGRIPLLISSARYGISLAARMLALEGRRVAVPGYVCPAVLTGLRAARVEAVAIDCLPASIRFDPDALGYGIAADGIAGVLAANTYGFDQDFSLLSKLGVPVIEDAAYQSGCTEAGGSRLCGTRGDVGVWSFNFKALTAIGGGVLFVPGEILTDSCGSALSGTSEIVRFINYAARSIGRHHIPASFSGTVAPRPALENGARNGLLEIREGPMSELQAAVSLAQLESRERLAEIQMCNSSYLADVIARCDALTTLSDYGSQTMVHLFPVLVRARLEDAPAAVYKIRCFLHARGVQTETPYPVLLGSGEALPNSHELATRMILVPCNASLGDKQMHLIGAALEGAAREVAREFHVTADAETEQ
ncbi:MAG: DegT/DnrJ/EryC1/StrS family aminotransferase [Pyrinomonadaceae bacterium]